MTVPTDAAVPRSLAELRLQHAELLGEHDGCGDSDAFLACIEAFIARGAAAGVSLEQPAERRSAQSVLDYWTASLYAAGRSPSLTILAPYEPAVVQRPLVDSDDPYPGLAAFTTADQHRFYGRELLVTDLLSRLREPPRVVAVTGPAGSGKSSLVQAGLIAALQTGRLESSSSWHYFPTLVPGRSPLHALAELFRPSDVEPANVEDEVERLRQSPQRLVELVNAHRPCVLFVDQLETVVASATPEADDFAANLTALASTPDSGCVLIVAARSDDGLGDERLATLFVPERRLEIPAPGVRELRDAIALPAAQVGLKFEHGVIADLAGSLVGAPAAPVLLQFVLERLWALRERDKNLITEAAYRKLMWDGQRHRPNALSALAAEAQRTFEQLAMPEQYAARQLLLSLIAPGEGWELRLNRVRRAQLVGSPVEDPLAARGLAAFAACGVVRLTADGAPDNPHVELTHVGLSRYWPLLSHWLEEMQELQRDRRRVLDRAAYWRDHPLDAGALLRGAQLEDARHFQHDLDPLLQKFVAVSLAAERRRRFQRTGALTGVLALLVACLALAVSLASQQYGFQTDSYSRQLAAQAQLAAPDSLDLSLLLALHAFRRSPTGEARDVLIEALEGNSRLVTMLGVTEPRIVAASPDGASLAIGQADGGVQVKSLRPGGIEATLPANGKVTDLAFSPGGELLVSAAARSTYAPAERVLEVWDLQTGLRTEQAPPVAIGAEVLSIAVSPTGLLGYITSNNLVVWDLQTGRELWHENAMSRTAQPSRGFELRVARASIAFSGDGQTVAVGECTRTMNGSCQVAQIQLYETRSGDRGPTRTGLNVGIGRVEFGGGRNGPTLYVHTVDGTLRMWDDRTGWAVADRSTPTGQHTASHFAVSDDGRLAALADCVAFNLQGTCVQNGIRLLDLVSEQSLPPLAAHAGEIISLGFDAAGSELVMASSDGVKVWNLTGRKASSADVPPRAVGSIVARGAAGDVRLVSAECPAQNERPGLTCSASSIRLWTANGTVDGGSLPRPADAASITALALGGQGQWLAAATTTGEVEVWDLARKALVWAAPRHSLDVAGVALGEVDGQAVVASVGRDRHLRLSKLTDGAAVRDEDVGTALDTVALSADGLIAAGDAAGQLYVWSGPDEALRIPPVPGSTGVNAVAFGQVGDLRLVAAADSIGTVRVWDAATGHLLATPPLAPAVRGASLEFTAPNAAAPLTLISHADGRDSAWQFDVDPSHFEERVCRLIHPSMRHGQDAPYLRRDPQFPSNLIDRFFGPGPLTCADPDGRTHV